MNRDPRCCSVLEVFAAATTPRNKRNVFAYAIVNMEKNFLEAMKGLSRDEIYEMQK